MVSHPNRIKELALAAAQTFNALKAQQCQQTQTHDRLSQATFTLRLAQLNFTLTGLDSIMESDTFKTLTKTVQKAMETWSTTVKNAICQVADLEMVKTKTEITANFLTTLKRIAHLLLLQDDPTTTIDSKFLAAFLLETNGTSLCKHAEISKNTALASLFDPVPYNDDTISEQLQDQLGGFFYDFLEITTAIFVASWNTQLNAYKQQAGDHAAAKQAKEYLDGSATVQAAALMDAEPSVDPALLKDIIKKQVDTETRQLRTELNKLKQIQLRSSKTPRPQKTNIGGPRRRPPTTPRHQRSPDAHPTNRKSHKPKAKNSPPLWPCSTQKVCSAESKDPKPNPPRHSPPRNPRSSNAINTHTRESSTPLQTLLRLFLQPPPRSKTQHFPPLRSPTCVVLLPTSHQPLLTQPLYRHPTTTELPLSTWTGA